MTLALEIDAAGLGHAGAPEALGQVRLAVSPGERVALLGGNGAGKTTLLKVAVGLLRPRSGAVRVFGVSIASPREAVSAGAGLVLQNPDDQLFGATVLDDALFGPENLGMSAPEARTRALEALERTGMAHLAERSVETLSFGEKKRAALAGVLAMHPALVLLDEPTAGLDASGEATMLGVLEALSARGATVVTATHDVDLVPLIAPRAVILGEGGVLADGPVREAFGDAALVARARLRAPWRMQPCARCGADAAPEALSWNAPRS
jgi:cobalt/nickel transport system ATP-binding protein